MKIQTTSEMTPYFITTKFNKLFILRLRYSIRMRSVVLNIKYEVWADNYTLCVWENIQ